jgi:DNA mismatch repair protein MSH6
LDELGRGTSTFDGTAIAHSVIEFLSDPKRVGCLTLFSTHYHMLLDEFKNDPRIAMYHMACTVQGEQTSSSSSSSSNESTDVVFLYKFIRGVCSKSFGMNVARLAGLPSSLVSRAHTMSQHFEERLEKAHKLIAKSSSSSSSSSLSLLVREVAAALEKNDLSALSSLQHKIPTSLSS